VSATVGALKMCTRMGDRPKDNRRRVEGWAWSQGVPVSTRITASLGDPRPGGESPTLGEVPGHIHTKKYICIYIYMFVFIHGEIRKYM
jgi:hypothetical protein